MTAHPRATLAKPGEDPSKRLEHLRQPRRPKGATDDGTPWHLLYVRGGKTSVLGEEGRERRLNEFVAVDELAAIGVEAWTPRRVKLARVGKERTPRPFIVPELPNFIFAVLPASVFYAAVSVRNVWPTVWRLAPADRATLAAYRRTEDARHAAELRDLERDEARGAIVTEYEPGATLRSLDARFADMLLRFRRVVEGTPHPMVEAETEMMGQTVRVRLDPLDVKRGD